jgi:hypothetical protein
VIETIWPPLGLNDWNDVLCMGGEGEGNWRRQAA